MTSLLLMTGVMTAKITRSIQDGAETTIAQPSTQWPNAASAKDSNLMTQPQIWELLISQLVNTGN